MLDSQVLAVRFRSTQWPLKRAGAPSHISCSPTSLRMGVNGLIQEPRPTVTSLAMAARIPILQPLSRRTGPMCKSWPSHLDILNIGSGLNGDIISDGE